VPLTIVVSDMAQRGSTRAEKVILLATIAIVGVTAPITSLIHSQIGFPLLVATLWLTTRRALLQANPGREVFPFRRRREQIA